MNTRTDIEGGSSPHPRGITISALVGLFAVVATLTAVGCEQNSGGDHGEAAHSHDGHAEGDGHDHAHDDGEHDEHDEGEAGHIDEVRLTAEALERYGVTTEPAQLWMLKPTVPTPARVAFNAEAMAHVGSPLRGRAVEIKVRLGDFVEAGQELVIVESPELGEAQAEYLQKRTAVLTAEPAAELSRIAWERAKGLHEESQGISLAEVQRREAEHRAAIAGVSAAEAAARASESRLRLLGMTQEQIATLASGGQIAPRHAIRAAIEGQVVEREVTLGELVGPDREALMVLADTRMLWVLADVPESQLAGIAVGARAWITFGSATGQVDGAAAPVFEGEVAFVAPLVDPATRTARVRIEVPASLSNGLVLRPGMFAQAEIVSSMPGAEDPAPVVAVPDGAIQTVEGGPAIFVPVPGEPDTFAKRAVTVGEPIGGLIPVYAGLVEGESFVVTGTFILKAELGKGSAAHEH